MAEPSPLSKDAASETIRQRQLRRLGGAVQRLRDELALNQTVSRDLLATAGRRPLTGDEEALAQALRQAATQLCEELRALRQEFEAIRQSTP
jgi:hypothetical protein